MDKLNEMTKNSNSVDSSPLLNLQQLLIGSSLPQAIYVAAKLKIADLLADGSKTIEELAQLSKTHPPSLYRILRSLCSAGIFTETENQSFALTPMAEHLRSDVPESLCNLAISYGEPWRWQSWGNILSAVKTGKSAFEETFGCDLFQYLQQNPETDQLFSNTMEGLALLVNDALINAYDFSKTQTLVDIGSSIGTFTFPLLNHYPKLKAVLFDLPHVIANADLAIEQNELSNTPISELRQRCQLIAGDFFKSVPTGHNAYFLKHILHDWDDERCLTILQNCRQAMTTDSRLLIIERIIPLGNSPSPAKINDLEMLVLTPGGRERTEAEFTNLLKACDFQISAIHPTNSPLYIIEATPTI
jgi:O-methyltransferase domain/Dimerisation domain